MFGKVLVANRGEIAIRIMRALQELGIRTVAVYSEADKEALHVQMADEAYYIGPTPSNQSYLSVPAIITVAASAQVDAIHPGYGFLAENAFFAEACKNWGIAFIGPDARAIREMGDKNRARELMRKAGVPVVPGSEGTVRDVDEALAVAETIGYPVLVKAAGGGGGRGIRVAHTPEELTQALERAASEAGSAFGNTDVYVEKYVEFARHIEVQVLADHHGKVIHLGERECSLQRRRQKLLEEAPAPSVGAETREAIRRAAVQAAEAVGYTNAGTVEFLYDEQTGAFYFIEMNTRIQVEHPVTELIAGFDIVKEQIRIAAGKPLRLSQEQVTFQGHAIECRINAEDPENRLLPSTGTVEVFEPPTGPWTRWDGMLYSGYKVTPFYDSLLGKLIVWGQDRSEAIARMQRALAEMKVEGVKTTIPLHQRILQSEDFQAARFHTEWLEHFLNKK